MKYLSMSHLSETGLRCESSVLGVEVKKYHTQLWKLNTGSWIINNLSQVEIREEIFRRNQVWIGSYICTCILRTDASVSWKKQHDFRDDKEI